MPCGCSSVGLGRVVTMLSIVARTNFISWRLAPSTTKPIGTPCPSVNRLRLTPDLARSVGLGPVFFPPERRFGHRPIHAQPVPIDAAEFVEAFDTRLPEPHKHIGLDPFLEAIVGGGFGAQVGLVQSRPLTAGAQHIKDGIGTAAVGHAWPPAAKAVRVHSLGEQRL